MPVASGPPVTSVGECIVVIVAIQSRSRPLYILYSLYFQHSPHTYCFLQLIQLLHNILRTVLQILQPVQILASFLRCRIVGLLHFTKAVQYVIMENVRFLPLVTYITAVIGTFTSFARTMQSCL